MVIAMVIKTRYANSGSRHESRPCCFVFSTVAIGFSVVIWMLVFICFELKADPTCQDVGPTVIGPKANGADSASAKPTHDNGDASSFGSPPAPGDRKQHLMTDEKDVGK